MEYKWIVFKPNKPILFFYTISLLYYLEGIFFILTLAYLLISLSVN